MAASSVLGLFGGDLGLPRGEFFRELVSDATRLDSFDSRWASRSSLMYSSTDANGSGVVVLSGLFVPMPASDGGPVVAPLPVTLPPTDDGGAPPFGLVFDDSSIQDSPSSSGPSFVSWLLVDVAIAALLEMLPPLLTKLLLSPVRLIVRNIAAHFSLFLSHTLSLSLSLTRFFS